MWIWFITVCAAFPIVWYAWNILCGSVSSAGPSHDSFLASSKLSANTGDRNSGTNEESKKKDSLLILYGSQTGTAESYANLLGREAKKMGFTTARIVDACEYNHEAQLAMERAVIFVLATYGEGEPTDSARELHTWLLSEAFGLLDFRNMSYTVFALGDSQYKYFCQTGKDIDARLQVLGAQRFYETGYGDADRDLEGAFESWQGPMWTVLGSIFGITTMYDPDMPTPCNTKLIYEEDAKESPIPYQKMSSMMEPTQKQPAYARLVENSELLQGGNKNRSTRLLVFDLQSTGVSFQAGDHVGILPCNPDPIVDAYAKILGLTEKDLNTVIRLVPTSGISRSLLPCRVTPRKALKWYVDLCGIPRKSALRAFAHYCTDPNQKEEFLSYLRPNDEAVTKYHAMQKELGTVHGFLSRFNTCRVPLAHFLELMPRIAPRYYSIASDILEHGKVIHVVAAIIPNGLCSNWLAQLQPSAEQPPIVPLFVRKSTFHLSMRFKTAPVVMIGPGTGVAPFIGFVHRRTAWKNKGHDLGDALLFFGCRSRHEDFICQEVMQNAVKTGVLNELVVAFSREGNKKVYVQHKLQEYEDKVCEALMDNGYLYICGDAKNMARDVESALIDILIKKTSMSRTKAVEFLSRLEKQDRYLKDVWTC